MGIKRLKLIPVTDAIQLKKNAVIICLVFTNTNAVFFYKVKCTHSSRWKGHAPRQVVYSKHCDTEASNGNGLKGFSGHSVEL